ncbi:MAG: class I SAM-dependent methyltransferase [FCB group bacterium]|jgi:SAM-dependent methyltransferase|nr:class I SAM-dependent methyltransferase [FCB group bacterium]
METKPKHFWQEFFNTHAPDYMNNVFIHDTLKEVDFLTEVMGLSPGMRVLDMGCGTGRHSIELARRGYRVTGVDISEGMLAEARKAATVAGVEVEFVQSDATLFSSAPDFDAALCLCEGAFALINAGEDPEEHDLSILRNIAAALKPNAPFLLTTLNGYRRIREVTQADVESGDFDPLTMVHRSRMEIELGGQTKSIEFREHVYTGPELAMLLKCAGFRVENIWGGTAGNWGKRPIDLDEMEMMAFARRA